MDFFQSAVKTLSVEISENFFSPISSNFSTSIQCKKFFLGRPEVSRKRQKPKRN